MRALAVLALLAACTRPLPAIEPVEPTAMWCVSALVAGDDGRPERSVSCWTYRSTCERVAELARSTIARSNGVRAVGECRWQE